MREDTMRLNFQEYLRKIWTAGYGCQMNADGTYVHLQAQIMWELWQAATRAAVPDGWRAVPVEPAQQMTVAAMDAYEKITRSTPTAHPNDLYRAMIAAAPEVQP